MDPSIHAVSEVAISGISTITCKNFRKNALCDCVNKYNNKYNNIIINRTI